MSPDLWYLWCIVGYLSGSISFALILGKLRGIDVRKAGSGNVGATNVGRLLGRKWGLLCFALDVLKGFAPVFVAGLAMGLIAGAGHDAGSAATGATATTSAVGSASHAGDVSTLDAWRWLGVAMSPVIGHMFPIWLKFKGGKGVATGFGVLLGVYPVLTLAAAAALVVWLVMAGMFRYVGLASVAAAMSLPLFVWIGGVARAKVDSTLVPFFAITGVLTVMVLVRHRGNLARTLAGTEPKIGAKK